MKFKFAVASLLFGLLVITALPGCGNQTETLHLYCGAGLRPPTIDAIALFEKKTGIKIDPEWGGSEMLLTRLASTGKGDLYMPGAIHYVEQAIERDLAIEKEKVCSFVPVIVTPKGNPANVTSLADFTRDGVKLGLARPDIAAVGRLSQKIFKKNNLDLEAIKNNTKFQSSTVNELLVPAKAGAVDAVIVWDGMAATIKDDIEIIRIPDDQIIISVVAIGRLTSSTQKEAAYKFIELLRSPEGQAIFKSHGYTVDDPQNVEADGQQPADDAEAAPAETTDEAPAETTE